MRNIGFPTAYGMVPIVCQSDIYDLSYGNPKARPTVEMAYDACERTFISTEPMSGNVGAGTGATVGKVCGMERAMKGGIGYAAAKLGDLIVGAVVVVNACGNVYDQQGRALGGVMDEGRQHILDACQLMFDQYEGISESKPMLGTSVKSSEGNDSLQDGHSQCEAVLGMEKGNTTIGAIVTNAAFHKGELTKIAMMATNGYARSIRPVGTLSDGDTIYAFSVTAESENLCGISKPIVADVNVVGTLAAELMCEAIEDTMRSSKIDNSEFLANIIDLHEVKI